jgi:hypothetical protein
MICAICGQSNARAVFCQVVMVEVDEMKRPLRMAPTRIIDKESVQDLW